MVDPIERYLEEVAAYADLDRRDEATMLAELREHIHALLAGKPDIQSKEIYPMLEAEFGKPSRIGRSIAKAKGRFRTYLKKQRRKAPVGVAVALVLGLAVRWAVAEPFYGSGHGVAPLVPYGSWVMVYKLTRTFKPGDIVAYRNSKGEILLGIVKSWNADGMVVERNEGADEARKMEEMVGMGRVIGRVICNTR
jgi:hypothetical protein